MLSRLPRIVPIGFLLASLVAVSDTLAAPAHSGSGGLVAYHARNLAAVRPVAHHAHRRHLHARQEAAQSTGEAVVTETATSTPVSTETATATTSLSSDGPTPKLRGPEEPVNLGGLLPPECESVCQPFSKSATSCVQDSTPTCACTLDTVKGFTDCATCAPALYDGYPGGLKAAVEGALEECAAAGAPVDYDTSSLPGSGTTGYTGPSDNELSSSAAAALSSAMTSPAGTAGAASVTDGSDADASSALATPRLSPSATTSANDANTTSNSTSSGNSTSTNSTSGNATETGFADSGAAAVAYKVQGAFVGVVVLALVVGLSSAL